MGVPRSNLCKLDVVAKGGEPDRELLKWLSAQKRGILRIFL